MRSRSLNRCQTCRHIVKFWFRDRYNCWMPVPQKRQCTGWIPAIQYRNCGPNARLVQFDVTPPVCAPVDTAARQKILHASCLSWIQPHHHSPQECLQASRYRLVRLQDDSQCQSTHSLSYKRRWRHRKATANICILVSVGDRGAYFSMHSCMVIIAIREYADTLHYREPAVTDQCLQLRL